VLLVLYDVEKSYVNAGIPEKSLSGIGIIPAVNFFSPASAFRHQGQYGTAVHELVRHCPAMLQWNQWWANLDQASKHLEVFRFRDLSPTPIP
jgi:hypothetical protein